MADATQYILNLDYKIYKENTDVRCSHINVGTGIDITIADLAQKIKQQVGYSGKIIFDSKMPDGTLRKCCDISKINKLGWVAKTDLNKGLAQTYNWYKENI